jgi:hypothetical protein
MNKIVRKMLGESVTKPVIVKQRSEDYQVCPHCNQEIYEKSLYADEQGILHHNVCKGAVELPPTDWSKISPEWRELLGGPK